LAAPFAGLLLFGMVGSTALAYPPPTGSVSMTLSNIAPATGATVSISATVLNQAGVAQSGLECTFQVLSQPGTGATVDATPKLTDASGIATTSLNVGTTPGAILVGATCGQLTSQVEVEVTAAAAPASDNLPSTGTGPVDTTPSGLLLTLLAGGLLLVVSGSAMRIATKRGS
jgi:hypothetical protein